MVILAPTPVPISQGFNDRLRNRHFNTSYLERIFSTIFFTAKTDGSSYTLLSSSDYLCLEWFGVVGVL